MRGLRTQESDKFNRFFQMVQNKAKTLSKLFFLDCGEGREFSNDDVEGEDLSGWLIPIEQADEFEKMWVKNDNLDKWADNIVFAVWRCVDNSKIEIEFKQY